jgi:hypothetical protein
MADYVATDAWADLARVVYRQDVASLDGDGETLATDVASTLVHLYQDRDGERISAAEQVADIIACATARGVAIQVGVISLGVDAVTPLYPPMETRQDISCAEALSAVLDWAPDAVCWCAPASDPVSFNALSKFALTSVNVDLAVDPPTEVYAASRPDLQAPGVRLSFEKTGDKGRVFTFQTAGSPDTLGGIEQTIELMHSDRVLPDWEDIVTEDYGDPEQLSWWARRFPWLDAATGVSFHDGAITPVPDAGDGLERVLLVGSRQSWMADSLKTLDVVVSVECDFYLDGQKIRNKPLEVPLTLTNLETKRYKGASVPEWTEEEPADLAACLYAAVSRLQYEGRIAWAAADPDAHGAVLGVALNLLSGQTGWASMAAVVQSVELRVDDGVAAVSFGPARHLAPQDWLELLRANRRRSATYHSARNRDDDGQADPEDYDADAEPDVVKPQDIPQAGLGIMERLQLSLPATAAHAHAIDVHPGAISGPTGAVTMQPREIICLELSGGVWTLRKRQVLCSEVYGDAVPGGSFDVPADWSIGTSGIRYKTRPALALGDLASTYTTLDTVDPHSGEHGA